MQDLFNAVFEKTKTVAACLGTQKVQGSLQRHCLHVRQHSLDEYSHYIYAGHVGRGRSSHQRLVLKAAEGEMMDAFKAFCDHLSSIPNFEGTEIALEFCKSKGSQKIRLTLGGITLNDAPTSGHIIKSVLKWVETFKTYADALPKGRKDWWGIEGSMNGLVRASSPGEALFVRHLLLNINKPKELTKNYSTAWMPTVSLLPDHTEIRKDFQALQERLLRPEADV